MSRRADLPTLVTVSGKNQITLPHAALTTLGARPGDQLSVGRTADGLILRRLGPSVVEQTAGSLASFVRRKR